MLRESEREKRVKKRTSRSSRDREEEENDAEKWIERSRLRVFKKKKVACL